MENIHQHIIDWMSINKDLDDHYFETQNYLDSESNLQCQTNPYQEFIQQQINSEDLLQKEIYWKNSTHTLTLQIADFPQQKLVNYAQENHSSTKKIRNSKELQEIYEKYHFEYLKRKKQNQIWQTQTKKILLSLKLSIKIAQKLQRKRRCVANKGEKINISVQFPQNQEITNYKKHNVLSDQSQIIKDSSMNQSGKCNKDQRHCKLGQHKLKQIRRIKKREENSNEMKFSSQEVIENIQILRTQKSKLLKPQLTNGKPGESFEKENQSSSNQISSLRKELRMKPSYQTIRILAQIYITQGYNYKIMEKIKYLQRNLENLSQHQRQQQLRFKSISNMSNRDYCNFTILIVRFSLRNVENLLIDFYKVQHLSRIKYYEFDLIRIMLLKFQEYFHEKLLTIWLKVVKLLFELENNIQIPQQYELIDLYVAIMKKLKNQIYVKVQKGSQIQRNKGKFLESRQVPLITDNLKCQDSELKLSVKKQNLVKISKHANGGFSQQKKQQNFKKSFFLNCGSQLEEIYQFTF